MNTGNDVTIHIPWVAVDPPLRSDTSSRSPDGYRAVVNQFSVATNPRYATREGKTYCNIFVWDVTRAMGAELPHWVDNDGHPASAGSPRAHRVSCNVLHELLLRHGVAWGWSRVSESEAGATANVGHPTIAIRFNPNGNGHVAVVLPAEPPGSGIVLAQAGRVRFGRGNRMEAFGNEVPEYWTHE